MSTNKSTRPHEAETSSPAADSSDPPPPIERFPPEEEAHLLHESHAQKSQANRLFSSSAYSEAIGAYDQALSSCPNYLEYEIAVLQSNIAACHLKLEDWKAAVESATKALTALDREESSTTSTGEKGGAAEEDDADDGVVVEIGEGEEGETALEALKARDRRKADVQKIRCKALLRRARGRMEQGGWGNLAGAEEDYKVLSKMASLSPADRRSVQRELATLPARINAAKDKEMGEMMGKLKELGNGILKPFGLSTDMFKMNKDSATGGYSMSFEQGSKSSAP